jgi:hypothetical protein
MTTEPLDDLDAILNEEADLDDSFSGDGTPDVLAAPAGVEESYLDEDDAALWEGDKGTLHGRQRDVLISLLKKAFVSSDDRAEWRVLTRDPGPIAANLNNLYLKLVIDERSEVAYAAPVRTSDNSFKTLVRDAPNNREETLLLMYLRERFRAATAAGEPHVFTDGAAMYDYVQRFRPSHATDQVGDERRVDNAITSLTTAGLLVRTRDDGRYRVHRAIEALLPLPKLQHLLDAFRAMNGAGPDTDEDTDGYAGKHAAPVGALDQPEEPAGLDHDDHTDGTDADLEGEHS